MLREEGDFTLTHGWIAHLINQDQRELFETYMEPRYAHEVTYSFIVEQLHTRHAIVGHTHKPGFFRYNGMITRWVPLQKDMIDYDFKLDETPAFRFVLNPGAILGARSEEVRGLKTAILINSELNTFRFIAI